MPCEMCGNDHKGCKLGTVDGVKMMLCPDCIRYATGIEQIKTPQLNIQVTTQKKRDTRPAGSEKDVFAKMEKELVSDWPVRIKTAREKKGLSREELGFRIGERTVTISKIEKGDLRPSDKMIEKLEKELGITLLEDVVKPSYQGTRSHSTGLTLGDFIRKEEE
ncbi:MAG: multiprotein bridging factor aMBF1 [Candidatus Thermoplasmatota archaeon]